MIVVHHLNNSRSQRIVWLLEELGVPYKLEQYQRDAKTMLAPPELRTETVPEPRRNRTWVAGHWEWRGKKHHWVKGHWIRDRGGYRYNQPTWVESNGRWHMTRGSWARGDSGGDGVRNSQDRAPNNPNRN